MMPLTARRQPTHDDRSSGGRLVAADGRTLPLRQARLEIEAEGGLARTLLFQTFENPHDEPLAVTYQLPLPERGAVSGFSFTVGALEVVGEVDRKAAARERFEEALALGQTAALLEQDRSSLFCQEVGNIPPHETITARIVVDQRLDWLAEGAWSWRFPTVVAPRYLGEPGRVPDAARIEVEVSPSGTSPRAGFVLRIRDRLAGGEPTSSSHLLHVRSEGAERIVGLSGEAGAALDRDLVVSWPVAEGEARSDLRMARPEPRHPHANQAFGLLSLLPPEGRGRKQPVPRDLIVLLDTSGSMHGAPLAQARHLTQALIRTLGAQDRLELIEFSSSARRFQKQAVSATERNRQRALQWVSGLSAGGATEMKTGILEALASLRDEAQRQVVLITDGLIGSEREIVSTVEASLPAGSRVHCVGVGSGVNRSLTGPVSRAGRGQEVILGVDEDPAPAAARLVAATDAPQVVDLRIEGSALISHAPSRIPDLYARQPALLGLRLKAGGGELRITGRCADGLFERRLSVPATAASSEAGPLPALVAREEIEDLELQLAGGREASEVDAEIEARGLDFQVATRLTSWVAVSREPTVDPRDPTRHERIPQALPHGMSIERLGLRAAAPLAPRKVVLEQPGLGSFLDEEVDAQVVRSMAAPPPSSRSRRKLPSLSLDGLFGGRGDEKQKKELEGAADEKTPRPTPPAAPTGAGGPADPDEGGEELGDFLPEQLSGEEGREAVAAVLGLDTAEAGEPLPGVARLLRRRGRSFTFELELTEAMTWAPELAAAMELELDGGTAALVEAAVDPRHTTRDGEYPAGHRLRLTLILEREEDWPEDLGEVLFLHLRSAGLLFELRIDA